LLLAWLSLPEGNSNLFCPPFWIVENILQERYFDIFSAGKACDAVRVACSLSLLYAVSLFSE